MKSDITHLGWDWTRVKETAWNEVSSEFLPVALEWAKKFKSMIDVGAGKGRNALFVSRLGLMVLAVDLAQSSVDFIREKNEELGLTVETCLADMTALPAADESFDCAVCFHTIYHTDYQGVGKALDEICRVLRVGGEAYITFNAKDNPSFLRGVPFDEHTIYKKGGLEDNIPHTYVDMEDIRALMHAFQIIKAQKTEDFVYNEGPARGIHFFIHARKR